MTKEMIQTAGGIIIPPEVRSFGFDDDEGGSSSKSPSGVKINSENAIQCMAVLACVRVLSESLASLPVHIYRRIPGGGKEVFSDHPAYKVIHSHPNDWQTSFEFRETLMTHLCLYGNAYCEIVREGRAGVVVALVPLHPSRMDVERLENGTLRYKYTEPSEGGVAGKKAEDVTFYKQEQIMHIRWMSNDSIKGMVPIELAREAIALARACEIHGARFFGGGARPGVVLQTEQSITEESARLIKEFWEKAHRGPWNAHKTAVLTGGLKAEELGGSNADAQFLDSRRYQSEEVCRFYRVPPHMIMDLSRSTFSNIEHQGMDFVTHSLMPWCRRFESVYTRDLLDDPELFIEFDVRGLLRGDASARAAYYNTMFQMGVLSLNEIRSFENMNPVPGGDEHYVPLNLAPLAATAPENKPPEPTPPSADINGIMAVVQQIATKAVTPDAAQAIFAAAYPQMPLSVALAIIAGAEQAPPAPAAPAALPAPDAAPAAPARAAKRAKKYDHIDFTPPAGVKEEAARGLEWRREYKRGGTQVGVARARDLSNGTNISPQTARRMKAYFDRHQSDDQGQGWSPGQDGFPSAGRIAWALWGGSAGWSWAKKLVKQMEAADNAKRAFCATGKEGGIDNSCGKEGGGGSAEDAIKEKLGDYEGASVQSDSAAINSVPMNHFTTSDAAESIKQEGFNYSTNSMYGQGVYFTDSTKSVYGEGERSGAVVQVSLKPHTQLVVERDTDVPRVAERITGKSFYGSGTREALVAAGVGSVRFKMDNETYTVVLDRDLIEVK